jgi:type III pantothenate kinase
LGVDRWLASIGGWFWSGQKACCVVDCGTAITIDVINHEGQHQGGLILPGLAKMHHILAHDTHALGQYFQDPPPLTANSPLLAKNSQDAIQFGIYYAIVGVIEHVMQGLANPKLPVLMTGGSAPLVWPGVPGNCHLVPDLVLQGLLKVSETI